MTTRINVFVGRPDLPQRAGQRQQSARLTQADKEAQRRTATQAVDAAIAAGLVSAPTAAARRALITNAERQLRLGNTTRLVPGLGALRSTTSATPASLQSSVQFANTTPASLQSRSRIVFDEPAANRRPEEAGTTGLVWRAYPRRPNSYFSAGYMWSSLYRVRPNTRPAVYSIDANDNYTYAIGSGDGTKWITNTLNFPGIHSFRESYYEFASPITPERVPGVPGWIDLYVSDPTGTVYNFRDFISDDSSNIQHVLPVGNGSAIVLIGGRAGGSWVASKKVITAAEPGVWFDKQGWAISSLSDPIGSDTFTVQASDLHAYVVSQTDCRQIEVPTKLRALLSDLQLSASFSLPKSWAPWPGEPEMTYYQATGPDTFWYDYYGNRYRKYELLEGEYAYQEYGLFSGAMDITGSGDYIPLSEHTPAAMTLLNNYSQAFSMTDFTSDDYWVYTPSEARSRLQSHGAPAPSHTVGFDGRLPDYQAFLSALNDPNLPAYYEDFASNALYKDPLGLISGLTVVRSNYMQEDWFSPVPEPTSWKTIKRLPLNPERVSPFGSDSGMGVYWHYDWAQPAYCRQQLLSLGFTEADFQP